MAPTAAQRYLAEFLGTFGLLVAMTGSAVLSLNLGLAPASYERITLLSLSIGFGLLGMIYAFGDLSGGHFNPAVTLASWVAGRTSAKDVVGYVLSQVAGALVGVGAIAGVAYGSGALWSHATAAAFASEGYSGSGSPYTVALGSVFLLEVVLTFLFVVVILFATRPESGAKNLAPLGIALMLTMANLVATPIDGASINPARSFAPAVLSVGISGAHWAIGQDWLFWVAPIVGGLLAAAVERVLRPPRA